MVDSTTHALGHLGVALSFGLVIMAMIYAVGHVSGAHFNPAVTLGFALTRHFPWPRVALYWGAQAIGAIAAALLLRASLGNVAHVGATLPSGSDGAVVPLGDGADRVPDVRDHGRRHRHARGRRGRRDRGRRHGRSRRAVRRPDLGGLDEPGPLARPGARLGRPALPLDLPDGAVPRSRARRGRLPARARERRGGRRSTSPREPRPLRLHPQRGPLADGGGAARARRRWPARGALGRKRSRRARASRGGRGDAGARRRSRRTASRTCSIGPMRSGPTSWSRWAAATRAPTSPASATSTGS